MADATNSTAMPVDSVLFRPTLGHPAHLGELYDARTDTFLRLQLYPEEEIQKATSETNINHVDFHVKMSNSFQDKVDLLDISAELSCSLLSGLVTIKGSGNYIHDAKSNSVERAWAMTLKAQLMEYRLRFAEINPKVVPKVVMSDYLLKDLATHFVSGVVYGGNLVVSLNEKRTRASDREHISGNLEAALNNLKGVVELRGKAEVTMDDLRKNLQDTFEFTVYGDIEVTEALPTSAEEVLEFLPVATTKFGKGVPTSVTLQPIPKSIHEVGRLAHKIEKNILDSILDTFTKLEDVQERFTVLSQRVASYKNFLSALHDAVTKARSQFSNKYLGYMEDLQGYLTELRTASVSEKHAKLIEEAGKLYEFHTPVEISYKAPIYPTNLRGLEQALIDFEDLHLSVANIGCQFRLANEMIGDIYVGKTVPVIFIPPLGPNPAAVLLRNTHFVRANSRIFPQGSTYVIYSENSADIANWLPGTQSFGDQNDPQPQLWVSRIEDNGELKWLTGENAYNVKLDKPEDLSPRPDWVLDPFVTSIKPVQFSWVGVDSRAIAPTLVGIDGTASFSISFSLELNRLDNDNSPLTLLHVLNADGELENGIVIDLRPHLCISSESANFQLQGENLELPLNKVFTVTFVQDITQQKRILYFNVKQIAEVAIDASKLLDDLKWKQLRVLMGGEGVEVETGKGMSFRPHSIEAFKRAIIPGTRASM